MNAEILDGMKQMRKQSGQVFFYKNVKREHGKVTKLTFLKLIRS